ncbi:dynein light chain [Echinococcus multilocularis]|uniref:Dynein light chain n=1 Tax=Echinococcus multilocularis TaxID=6211 RepID=A0A087VXR1_ECHMU|nr:dynein light chain [Echinococcus multilocularis]
MSVLKAKVVQTDMKESMQQEAVNACAKAIAEDDSPIAVANAVRKHFDEYYGPSWTCTVGRDFSSAFAYQKRRHISLSMGGKQILLFKSA